MRNGMYFVHCHDDLEVVREAYQDGVEAGKAIGNNDEFVECYDCSQRPGSPRLCDACIHNRDLITRLKSPAKKKKEKI